jgi:hypothetical protein
MKLVVLDDISTNEYEISRGKWMKMKGLKVWNIAKFLITKWWFTWEFEKNAQTNNYVEAS